MTSKVYNKQIGGSHYKIMKIQPSKFVIENKLLFPEGNVIKYICRHPYKGKKEDLLKAKHFIDMIIERDYPDTLSIKDIVMNNEEGLTKLKNSWGIVKE